MRDVVGVWLGSLDGTTWWEQDADEPVLAASLMKVPVAMAALALDLDAQVCVHPDFDSVVAGERFELDEENARLLCDGKAVDLPPRPFELLCALARRPGLLLTKNALLDEVWGHRFVSESVLKTVIAKLRIVLLFRCLPPPSPACPRSSHSSLPASCPRQRL